MKKDYLIILTVLILSSVFCFNKNATGQISQQQSNDNANAYPYSVFFQNAYQKYPDIPKGMLEAVAYTITRIHHIDSTTSGSCVGLPRVYGVMGLTLDGKGYFRNNLNLVSKLSTFSVNDIINNPEINILAYAAAYSSVKNSLGIHTNNIEQHVSIVKALSEIPDDSINEYPLNSFVYSVFTFLKSTENQAQYSFPNYQINLVNVFGVDKYKMLASPKVLIDSKKNEPQKRKSGGNSFQSSDYAPALWNPTACYTTGRTASISAVAIHDMEGYYAGTISWFLNCANQVSAHYVIRSTDGQITQMVAEANKAWHIGSENSYTIGIEHEGFCSQTGWYTDAMYCASALLVKDICNSGYGISPTSVYSGAACTCSQSSSTCLKSSYNIKGHQMFPNQTHCDPGINWDWAYYYSLINGANCSGTVIPPVNDNCPGTAITSNGSCLSGTVAGATGSYGTNQCLGCSCASPDNNDVYYYFTAQSTSETVTVSNYASNFDAVIELRKACASGTGNYISCYDPVGAPSSVSYTWSNLTCGQTYYIRVFEYNSTGTPPSSPTFQICVTHSSPCVTDCNITSLIPSSATHNPLSFSTTPGSDDIIINASAQPGCTLTVTGSCAWLTYTLSSGTTNSNGQAFLNYSITANTSTIARTCTLFVNGSPLVIKQNGCTNDFWPVTKSVPASSSTYNLDIDSYAPCSWSIPAPSYNWVHLSQLNGVGDATISVTVDANNTCVQRTCTLSISPGSSTTHIITQQGGTPPPIPNTSVSGYLLTCNNCSPPNNLQWYYNGNPVGALNQNPYTASIGGGDYWAVCTNPAGCSSSSQQLAIINVGLKELNNINNISIYPNPNNGMFTIETNLKNNSKLSIKVFDTLGKVTYQQEGIIKGKFEIDLRNKAKGIYFVQLNDGQRIYLQKLIIQ